MRFVGLKTVYVGEEFRGEQKFVINRYSTRSNKLFLFDFYGVDLWPDSYEEPDYILIAEGFKLNPENMLGGGRVKRASPTEMLIYGESGIFGGVPRDFLEFTKDDILKGYREHFPEIERIVIETPRVTINDEKISFLKPFLS